MRRRPRPRWSLSENRALQAVRGYRVSKDYPGQQGPQEAPDRRALLALLGVMELMVGMVLMAWAVLLVLSALLVAAVSRAHRGLTETKAPPVRRVPPGYQVRPGSRAHRDRSDPRGRPPRQSPT